jgi:hypothetical protein
VFGSLQDISSTHLVSHVQEDFSAKPRCVASAVVYIQLVKSPTWPYARSDEVLNEFRSFDDATWWTSAEKMVGGWPQHAPRLALHGKGWHDVGAAMLPLPQSYGKMKCLYLNFLTVRSLALLAEHIKVYGGMAAGSGGL